MDFEDGIVSLGLELNISAAAITMVIAFELGGRGLTGRQLTNWTKSLKPREIQQAGGAEIETTDARCERSGNGGSETILWSGQ